MTCTYDGLLTIGRTSGNTRIVEPCCEGMHKLVIAGLVYVSNRSTICLRTEPKKPGQAILCCPYCGSKAVVE